MRGNETVPVPCAIARIEFPIPMRGNESFADEEQPYEFEWFPIPMRGNEVVVGGALGAALAGFPIPMRGNEVENAESAVRFDAREFPIPMRGNEGSGVPAFPPRADGSQGSRLRNSWAAAWRSPQFSW